MKRVRLLIYDGPKDWIEACKRNEKLPPGRLVLGVGTITSIELTELLKPLAELSDVVAPLVAVIKEVFKQ